MNANQTILGMGMQRAVLILFLFLFIFIGACELFAELFLESTKFCFLWYGAG
jgi:hypothetical protein